jgi:hypothetical protein
MMKSARRGEVVSRRKEGGKVETNSRLPNQKLTNQERRITIIRKKKWLTIMVIVAALVVVIATVGGIAYAQTGTNSNNNSGPDDPAKTLYARVATILGIDQQKLEDAFAQAQQEMRNEELTNRLNGMVQQGTITQSEADAYLNWWQARPDIAALEPGLGGGPGFPGGPHGMPGPGRDLPPADTSTTE